MINLGELIEATGHVGPWVMGPSRCRLCGWEEYQIQPVFRELHPQDDVHVCTNCGQLESALVGGEMDAE